MKQWMIHVTLVDTDGESTVTTLGEYRKFINIHDEVEPFGEVFSSRIKATATLFLRDAFEVVENLVNAPDVPSRQPVGIDFVRAWARVMHGGEVKDLKVDTIIMDDLGPDLPPAT